MNVLKAKELKQMLDSGENILLLYPVSYGEFQRSHIPGSINIPVDSKDFVGRVRRELTNPDHKIVVYGKHYAATPSIHALKKLRNSGYENTYELIGGMDEWRSEGYEVISKTHAPKKKIHQSPVMRKSHEIQSEEAFREKMEHVPSEILNAPS